MADLFTVDELAAYLQADVNADTTASLQLAHDLTVDMLLEAMHRTALPDPPPPGLKSLAIGVAARMFTNPTNEQAEPADGGPVQHGMVLQPTAGAQLSDRERKQARRLGGVAAYSVPAAGGGGVYFAGG